MQTADTTNDSTDLEHKINTIKASMDAIREKMDTVQKGIDNLDKTIENLQRETNTIKTAVDAMLEYYCSNSTELLDSGFVIDDDGYELVISGS